MMRNEVEKIAKRVQYTRLVVLGLTSIMLTTSIGLFLLAPIPLVIASISSGRRLGYLLGRISLCLITVLSLSIGAEFLYFQLYLGVLFISAAIIESIERDIAPIKAIVFNGVLFSALTFLGSTLFIYGVKKTTYKDFISQTISDSSKEFKDKIINSSDSVDVEAGLKQLSFLDSPDETARLMLIELPGLTLMLYFITFWLAFYMALRIKEFKERNTFLIEKVNARSARDDGPEDYQRVSENEEEVTNKVKETLHYNSHRVSSKKEIKRITSRNKALLNFKMPDIYIWGVIAGLAILYWNTLFPDWVVSIGHGLIYSLGAFYFIQGFGLYISFLNHLKLFGLLRVVLITVTVMTAHKFIAIIGLFDMFIDFRKYLKKKK